MRGKGVIVNHSQLLKAAEKQVQITHRVKVMLNVMSSFSLQLPSSLSHTLVPIRSHPANKAVPIYHMYGRYEAGR